MKEMIPQALQNPYPIEPGNISQLIAVGASYSGSIDVFGPMGNYNAKQFWLTQWSDPAETISWRVAVSRPGMYRVIFLLKCEKGREIRVTTSAGSTVFTASEQGWQRSEGQDSIELTGMQDTITLQLAANRGSPLELKAVELIHEEDYDNITSRIEAFRGDTNWMKEAGYGVMVQVGGWSYPPTGDKKPWPGFAEDFDAAGFTDKIAEMGGKFLVWSATWYDYLFPAPIEAIREILPERVSSRDLIGDLITCCRERGIRFMMYYHLGHEMIDVLQAKGWRESWEKNGWDRQAWYDREERIFREIGERYGRGLDAVFLDDVCSWYPTNFESLGTALKTGNPDRLIGYNAWIAPLHTPFQDFFCGEGFTGLETPWHLDNGIAAEGPQKGLQVWGTFILDGPDWGIRHPDTKIDTPIDWTVEKIVEMTKKLEAERYSVSFNLLAYEDGSISPDSYELLKGAAERLGRSGRQSKMGRSC